MHRTVACKIAKSSDEARNSYTLKVFDELIAVISTDDELDNVRYLRCVLAI